MKKLNFFIVGFSFFVIGFSICKGDDSFFYGEGVSVYPATGTKIRMVSEKVSLKKVEDDALAECDFYFVNPENEASIVMGFPAQPDERAEEEGSSVPAPGLIKDFKVYVNNRITKYELKKSFNKEKIPGLNFEKAFIWKVRLPRNEIIHVRNTYRFGTSFYYHNSWDKIQAISYILKTGALWNGKIDKAEISLDLGPGFPFTKLAIAPGGYVYEKGLVQWDFRDFKPNTDILVEIHERDLKNHKPEKR